MLVQEPSGKLTIEKALEQLNAKNDIEALRLFDQAISEGSDLPGINYGKAFALARIGRVDAAIALLEELLNRIPNYGLAQNLRDELKSCSSSDSRAKNTSLTSSEEVKALSQWMPSTLYPDDIFITSYPKSGNTWLRFLLANLLKQQDEEIDFHTVHNYVPEVGKQEEIIKTLRRPRVMKSHAPYISEYPKVIYLIRDGRDVYSVEDRVPRVYPWVNEQIQILSRGTT
jgi:tetratricopeptide (TPR) repeat protein